MSIGLNILYRLMQINIFSFPRIQEVIVGLARQYLNSLLQTEAISTVILETN